MRTQRHDAWLPVPAPGTDASASPAPHRARPESGAAPAAARFPALSVVVPMKDEAENVVPLVAEIVAALASMGDHEILLVDDGSTDATLLEMQKARATHGRCVRVIRHDRNRGQSTAIRTGVRAARGELVATLDGDGQNDPADLPRLVQELQRRSAEGVAMVVGERLVRHDSFIRRVCSRIANRVRGALLRDGVRDTGCGIKVFARTAFLELPAFDHMHRFLPVLVRAAGGDIVTVPVTHRPRRAGRSKYGIRNRLWVGIVDLFGVLWLLRRHVAPDAGREECE